MVTSTMRSPRRNGLLLAGVGLVSWPWPASADPDGDVPAEGPAEVPPVEHAARSTLAAATPAIRLHMVLIQEV